MARLPLMHAIVHVEYEQLGFVGAWGRRRGWQIATTRAWTPGAFAALPDADLHVVLGGPMGACDEREHPWIRDELGALERLVERGAPVLGICLGAQLLARLLGAPVRRLPAPEIGWHRIELTDDGAADGRLESFAELPGGVLQWHYDGFELPSGTTHLAASPVCPVQAFAADPAILALQFHPEITPDEARDILARDGANGDGDYVQTASRILDPERFDALASATDRFMDALVSRMRPRAHPPRVAGEGSEHQRR